MKNLKKKGVVIDKVSEDSFFENLLLGLTVELKSSPFISNIHLERLPSATELNVKYWEYTSGVYLPQDLRDFYLSTNGFCFTYKFCPVSPRDQPEVLNNSVLNGICINTLQNLKPISSCEVEILAPNAKIFTLTSINDCLEIVMVYFNPREIPTFWLYWKGNNLYFLSDNFTTYFRMAVAHLGVFGWQLTVLDGGIPEWTAEIFQIIAPGVLEKAGHSPQIEELNVIDPEVFQFEPEDVEEVVGGVCEKIKKEFARVVNITKK